MGARTRAARGTTFGGFAFASLLVAALSGVALALPFDVRKPYDSIAVVLLTNPGARFYRSVHYVAAQLFLLLTIVHAWDHFRRGTERRVAPAMWARVTLLGPVAVFLMLSGFVLKGDAEGMQAFRILTTVVHQVPLIGPTLSLLLFGADPGALQVLYVHHVATATICVWLFTAEHARGAWPKLVPVGVVAFVSAALAFFVSPALHDGFDLLLRGPWYFLGLQELLHWAPRAGWLIAAFAIVLLVTFVVPRVSPLRARWAKRALAACLVSYLLTTAFALLFRGENWALGAPTMAKLSGLSFEPLLATARLQAPDRRDLPIVLNRREGCLYCHRDTTGLSASHRPDAVGCASCHAGNPFSLDPATAHRGVIRIPGNLSDAQRSCGLAACHPGVVERVQASVMTTLSGVVSVDRAVFGEAAARAAHVSSLGHTAADMHLRQLCASCHVGAPKTRFGPIEQTSRGGGCNACHLTYSREARQALDAYERNRQAGTTEVTRLVHPEVTLAIGNDHCFGCHSRSGRISTSYEGWQEEDPAAASSGATPTRTLEDGRRFVRVRPDVHFEKGMLCVDCHTAREVMGDGVLYARKSQQVRIACEDCHATALRTARVGRLDPESRRILAVTGQPGAASSRTRPFPDGDVVTTRGGRDAFLNTFVDEHGVPGLTAKKTGERLPLKPPAPDCTEGRGHERLSCASCHAAWAPRCTGCHTAFNRTATAYDHLTGEETRGAWVESGSDYRAEPPTLGVRMARTAEGGGREVVDTFAPGMVLTIERPELATPVNAGGTPPAAGNGTTGAARAKGSLATVFKRLYARTVPHTISKGSRSCQSCHNDPIALGYGRGRLLYEVTPPSGTADASRDGRHSHAAARGRWTFTPDGDQNPYDRLPRGAWTGFLQTREGMVSSRDDVRPFTADEQKRILTAGACLTCHRGDSTVMKEALEDFKATVARVTRRCAVPTWD
jgi:hypothetical protein